MEFLELLTPALAAKRSDLEVDDSFAERVKHVLKRSLASGRPSMAAIARNLGVSDRTLQRRITAFIMLGAPGQGDLAAFAREHYPVLSGTDFSTMTRDALVVNGDKDKNPRFSDRDQWRAEAFTRAQGPRAS